MEVDLGPDKFVVFDKPPSEKADKPKDHAKKFLKSYCGMSGKRNAIRRKRRKNLIMDYQVPQERVKEKKSEPSADLEKK